MHSLELWRNFICGNETGSPGRAVSLHLARSGSQSEHRIRRILYARSLYNKALYQTRPGTTHIYAMRTYFSPWQTSTANVTKPFLRKPAHPLRLNIGTLQNLPSCFHTSRFKSITSIHCQRPLQKHVNNHIDNVNGVTFVTRKHMFPQGPIFQVELYLIFVDICS